VIFAQDGRTLNESADILERWREYCETLYTNTDMDTYDLEPGPASQPVPSIENVKKHSNPQRAGKQQGQNPPDGIGLPIELFKFGEDSVVKTMHRIIECVGPYGKP